MSYISLGLLCGDLNTFSIWVDSTNKIKLSQFTSAFNPDFKVDNAVRTILPLLNQNVFDGYSLTPYTKDVFWIACLAWHIIEGLKVTLHSISAFKALNRILTG